jgi:hypothetical protein
MNDTIHTRIIRSVRINSPDRSWVETWFPTDRGWFMVVREYIDLSVSTQQVPLQKLPSSVRDALELRLRSDAEIEEEHRVA